MKGFWPFLAGRRCLCRDGCLCACTWMRAGIFRLSSPIGIRRDTSCSICCSMGRSPWRFGGASQFPRHYRSVPSPASRRSPTFLKIRHRCALTSDLRLRQRKHRLAMARRPALVEFLTERVNRGRGLWIVAPPVAAGWGAGVYADNFGNVYLQLSETEYDIKYRLQPVSELD